MSSSHNFRDQFQRALIERYQKSRTRYVPENFDVLCYGVPRSASTLVWQIANRLTRGRAHKTHGWLDWNMPLVVSYRDFRDAAVSAWQTTCPLPIPEQMPILDVIKQAQAVVGYAELADKYLSRPGAIGLRYEDYVDPAFSEQVDPRLVRRIASGLRLDVSRQEMLWIVKQFSLAANKRRADKMDNFSQWDRRTEIHGRHIHSAGIGRWREVVDNRGAEVFTKILGKWLQKFGYEM